MEMQLELSFVSLDEEGTVLFSFGVWQSKSDL